MDCSPPGSCVHGILQARRLEWVAMPSFRRSQFIWIDKSFPPLLSSVLWEVAAALAIMDGVITAGGDLDQGLDGLWALATSAGSRRKPCTRKQCWEVTPPTKSANINWADGLWHLCLSIRQTHEPSRAQWGPEGWRLLSSSTVVTKVTNRSPQKGTSLVVQG